jgi:5-methylcytosine-specific restriction endonuclease McrA
MDTTGLPRTRKEAKALGLPYYFTGEPCKHGHLAPRKTKGACLACLQAEWKASQERRADYFREYNKSDAGKQAKEEYYARNRTQVIARAQSRPTADKQAYKKAYKQENPDLYKTLTSFRRRRFRDATPPWLTHRQKSEIRQLYQIAITMSKTTGERYVVDHIIPLQGESVCGLHVPWNLRVITQEENLVKSNKME